MSISKNMFKIFPIILIAFMITGCAPKNQRLPTQNLKYERLEKIGDLRDRGILTQEEFEIEKILILNRHLNKETSLNVQNVELSTDIPPSNTIIDKCLAISNKYNPLISEAFGNYCLGHSVSFDFYSELQTNGCGEYKELISISKKGYEDTCVDGKKDGVNRE